MAADFLSEYGIRLADVVLEWPPREVLALAEGLPVGSRFMARMAGGDKWRDFLGWDADRHLQANIWDLHAKVNTAPGKKAPTYPRPAVKKASEGIPLMSMFPRRKG